MTATHDLPLRVGLGRLQDYWVTAYRRTWRASVAGSFLSPLFYVLAMGVLLGGFIAGDPDELEGATSYLAFVVPGLVASQAMMTAVGETTYPVMSMIKWQKVYESMLATPLQVSHVVLSHLGFVLFRVATTSAVFMVVVAPFGVFATWWGPLVAFVAQVLVGLAFGSLVYGLSARMHDAEGYGVIYRLGVFPLFLFSGAFFPIANLGDVGACLARLTPLWHGVNLSRMFCVDEVDWSTAAVNAAVLVALVAFGAGWSVRGLQQRMVT